MKYIYWMMVIVGTVIVTRWLSADEPVNRTANKPVVNLDSDYAKAQLALAQANLHRVEGINQRVARGVSANVVDDYRNEVAVANSRLAAVEHGDADPFRAWLASAEANWRSANNEWQSAVAANRRTSGTVNDQDVERYRLRAEVYRINLDRGQAVATQPQEAKLAWRVSVLSDEIERLNDLVLRLGPQNSNYSYWRY